MSGPASDCVLICPSNMLLGLPRHLLEPDQWWKLSPGVLLDVIDNTGYGGTLQSASGRWRILEIHAPAGDPARHPGRGAARFPAGVARVAGREVDGVVRSRHASSAAPLPRQLDDLSDLGLHRHLHACDSKSQFGGLQVEYLLLTGIYHAFFHSKRCLHLLTPSVDVPAAVHA